MAGDAKDVELRIRARDYSQKTFEQLAQTLADLVKAQDKQLEAAKRGEVTARGLEKSYQAIENAAKALIAQGALVKTFQSQSEAMSNLQDRLAKARATQEEYARSVAGAEKLTKDQNQTLKDNAKEVSTAERALAKVESRLAATTGRMAEFGIDTAQAAATQQKIVAAVGQANTALERQHTAMDTLEADVAQHGAAAKKANDDLVRSTQAAAEAREKQKQIDAQFAAAALDQAARVKKARDDELAALKQREQQLQVDRQFGDAQVKQAESVRKATEAEANAAKAAAEATRAQRDALNAAADQAERLSREYSRMAGGGRSSFAKGFAQELKDIADPATAAVRSLDGVDAALVRVEGAVKNITGPLKNYKATLAEVEGVQKSLQSNAAMVDVFQRQMVAVRGAREEFVRARSALSALTDQARSGNAGATLANDMTAAQAALKRAATAMADQTSKARTMRDALREAGVDTRNLGGAMDQMTSQAQRARGAVEQLEAGYKKYGAEIEKAAGAQKMKWFEGGRTTLSWMQRIRGELLSITAGYVGLQAAINLAAGAIDAYRAKQTIEIRLSQVVGDDVAAIAKEWDYLQGQAKRLGFAFQPLALSYSKFSIAAKSNNLTLQESRFIFEKFAEGARVAKLSTDDFEGALKAVEQMLSKGQIQAEELRGQLADRLPAAMGLMARAYGGSMADLNKAMEKGEVSAEYVIDLAREVGKEFGPSLERATKSFDAANGNLQTSIFNFKLAIAEGGFIEAYTQFLIKLTELFNSQEGKQLAQGLSDAFTAVVDILRWCAENLDTLKLAFAGFMALNVFGWLSRITGNFALLRTEIMAVIGVAGTMFGALRTGAGALTAAGGAATAAAGGVTAFSGAVGLLMGGLRLLLRMIPIVGAAMAAFEIYSLLTGKKGDAKKAGQAVRAEYEKGLGVDGTEDPGRSGSDNRTYNALGKELERQQKALDKKKVTADMKGAKGEIAERKRLVDEQFDALRKQAETGIKDETKRKERLTQINKLSLQAQAIEEKKYQNENAKSGQAAADKKVRLAREVADELARIEDDLAKKAFDVDKNAPYEERRLANLNAISHEYDKLMRKIDQMVKFDAKGAAKAKETVKAYIEQRQKVEGIKSDQEELSRLESQVNAQLQLRTTIYDSLVAKYAAGNMEQTEFQAAVLQNNVTMAAGVGAAAEKLRDFATSIKDLLRPEQYQTIMARVETMLAQNDSAAQNAQQSLTFGQESQNRLLNEYKRQQEEINAKEAAGVILKHEATNAQAELNGRYREQVIAAATELQALATAATNPANKEAMAQLIADAENLKTKWKDARIVFTEFEQTVVTAAAESLNGAFDGMIDALEQVVTGQMSVADGFKEMGRQSLLFFAQFLRDIALAILKQQLLNALKNSGNPYLEAVGIAMGAATKHTGGTVGSPGGQKRVDSSVFSGAARFHEGGLPGLTAKEVPAILERGEEVLTRDDPRNVLNGGRSGGGGSSRVVLVDDRESAIAQMTTRTGETALLQVIKNNSPTIRNMLKG